MLLDPLEFADALAVLPNSRPGAHSGACMNVIVTRWSRPAKTPAGVTMRASVRDTEGFHADLQEAVAGLTLDDLVRMSLFCQCLSQQALEQAEGMCVQFT